MTTITDSTSTNAPTAHLKVPAVMGHPAPTAPLQAGTTEALLTQLLEAAQQQNQLLERIAMAVEAGDDRHASPNYEVCLTQFRAFDWGAIHATVEHEDEDGVAIVLWRGHRYVRRSAANKFDPAIWFSRSQGKDESGNNRYARLVTFKLRPSAEPLPRKVKEVQGYTSPQ